MGDPLAPEQQPAPGPFGLTGVTRYVDSTATGTGDGTSWANAFTTIQAAIAASVAGDDFDIFSGHVEGYTATTTLNFKGTPTSPNRIFSCGKTNSPATAADLQPGATISVTGGNFNYSINNSFYCYGVTFNSSGNFINGANGAQNDQIYDTCQFNTTGAANASQINFGSGVGYPVRTTLKNCSISLLGNVNAFLGVGANGRFENCTISAPTSTGLVKLNTGGVLQFVGCDFSAITGGRSLIYSAVVSAAGAIQFIGCKLAPGTTFAVPFQGGTGGGGGYIDFLNCDSGPTGYVSGRRQFQGSQDAVSNVYNAATDGVTPQSWQITTTAADLRQAPFETVEIAIWAPPGTYAASQINVASTLAGLTNVDIWATAQVLTNAGFPQTSKVTTAPATELTAGVALPAGPVWAVPPAGSPVYYALKLPAFTVAIAGYLRVMVKVAKPSIVAGQLYVDPQIVLA